MTLQELKDSVDSAVKEGSIDPNKRIEIMDQIERVSDQYQSLRERIADLPEPDVEEAEV